MAIAKKKIAIANEIGVIYIDIGIIWNVPKTFTITGILIPIVINIDCFEKKPEFLIVYLIKFIKDPTWENFLGLLQGVALVVAGIATLMGGWVVALVAVGVAIVANIIQNWVKAKEIFKTIGTWINDNVIKPVVGFFTNLWKKIGEGISAVVENVKTKFNLIKTFISGVIKSIVNTFKTIGTKVGEVIGGAFKTVINGVLKMVENVINSPINAINGLLDKINDVPGINLKKLNTVKLPRLEVGGVVNLPGRGVPVGGAIGGERGAEGVIPLTNTQMMEQLGQTIGRYITVNNHITTTLNGRVIGRELKRSENESDFAFNK